VSYVLDTNTVSFLMRGDRAVIDRLTAHARTEVLLPQPVVAELAYGIARLAPSTRKTRLQQQFGAILMNLLRIDWTDDVSKAFGMAKATLERDGNRIDDIDLAIAAHALAANATLVTDNLGHMERIPDLRVENWRA
jgi:tRNA(fMet)-specific endonuclease VapC